VISKLSKPKKRKNEAEKNGVNLGLGGMTKQVAVSAFDVLVVFFLRLTLLPSLSGIVVVVAV